MIHGALDQIGAVTRGITSREHEGRPARVLSASQTYDSDRADVWDALTSQERIPRWFLPVSGDLRPGGQYQFEGNAGGRILEFQTTDLLALTWEYGGRVSWLTVRLSEVAPRRTMLELEHLVPSDDPTGDEFGPGAVGVGWDMALLGLATHLRTRAPVDPQAAMQWTTSEEGTAAMTESSNAWAAANIAAGAHEGEAHAAAARTTAAYTAAPSAEAQGDGSTPESG